MDGRNFQPDDQTVRARNLRQAEINAETKLWKKFRKLNSIDLKIRRQHPVGPFIVDFFCSAAKLALEIDGGSHEGREDQDAARDKYLCKMGIETMRVPPSVADDHIDEFVARFREECRERAASLNR